MWIVQIKAVCRSGAENSPTGLLSDSLNLHLGQKMQKADVKVQI